VSRPFTTKDSLLNLMSDGKPRNTREVTERLGVTARAAESACCRYWKAGLLLRSEKPLHAANRVFAGRAGTSYNTRSFYLFVLGNGGEETATDNVRFLSHSDTPRTAKPNKAQLVINFLRDNGDRAFYTTEIAARLKESGVTIRDVGVNLRRYEKRGQVYFRGYRHAEHETPFAAGYIVTYVDPNKPREMAIAEATERTDLLLEGGSHANPLADRIRTIRDELLKAKQLKEIVSMSFLKHKLHCNEDQMRTALDRALQLYKDEIREAKVFNFPYFYHSELSDEDLKVAIEDKKDYIRRVKGRHNRIGHNWEACVEFFVDKLTKGAEFWEQTHRSRMDRRRITLKLLRPTGERKLFAEVDRVWTIQPSPISQPVTYVLECKWGLVRKESLEDFLNVLKWSMDFGFDSQHGRMIKQGVIGIFAGWSPRAHCHGCRRRCDMMKAVEAARKHSLKVFADMMAVKDKLCRARQMEQLGVDGIFLHTGLDERTLDPSRTFLSDLPSVLRSVRIPVAVGGGITSEAANAAIDMGARLIVVSTTTGTEPFESVIASILRRPMQKTIMSSQIGSRSC